MANCLKIGLQRVLVKLQNDRDLDQILITSLINILISRTFIFNNTSQCPEAVAHRCSAKSCSEKIWKIHRKTTCWTLFLNNISSSRPTTWQGAPKKIFLWTLRISSKKLFYRAHVSDCSWVSPSLKWNIDNFNFYL